MDKRREVVWKNIFLAKGEPMGKKMKSALFVFAAVLVTVFLFTYYVILPNSVTKSRLEDAAMIARGNNFSDGQAYDKTDWWGNPIVIKVIKASDGSAISYITISAGKDGKFDSDDDLRVSRVDINVSKQVGKFLGKTGKEVVKGVKEGIKEKSKFD